MLRPTPGDPWGVEQHHWNTGAEENQQLNLFVSAENIKAHGDAGDVGHSNMHYMLIHTELCVNICA